MWVTRLGALLYAVEFLGICSATPLRRPLSVPKNIRRATSSSDPSCPDGFFCQQQSCPDDVKCPSGEECLNFEGNFACAPPGLKWCALNPTSLEAVGCSSGSCCHGNCYSSAAVCCDFPSIKCSIGKQCNICNPGERCGDSQCVGSNPSTTATTRTTSSTTTTAVPPPVTTTTTTTTKPPVTSTTTTTSRTATTTTSTTTTTTRPSTTTTTSVTSTTTTKTTSTTTTTQAPTTTLSSTTTTTRSSTLTTTTTSTTSTTSTVPPMPTIVENSGSFSFIGCFADAESPRVLAADSSESQGSSGMTLEKCIELAKQGAWRYAGVEYSYQCFVGNTIHNGVSENKGDCNMACAGNPGQTCGGGNRVQIYEDSTWKDPTLEELADGIRLFNSTVQEAREVIDTYQDHLHALQGLVDSSSSKVKRADGYEEIELQVMNDQTAAKNAQADISNARTIAQRLLQEGRQLDTLNEADPSVPFDAVEDFISAAESLAQQITSVILDMEQTAADLAEAIAAGTVPAIDVPAALATVEKAIAAIGVPVGAVAGVATGIFGVMAGLLALFAGSGDDHTTTLAPTTTTAIPTTTTTTTTSSTSTCTSTATPTTIIVFTKQGTTLGEFNEFVAGLPKDPVSIKLTNSWQPNFMYVGEVDQCTAEALDDNELVDSWSIDALIDIEDSTDSSTTAKRSTYNETVVDGEASGFHKRGNPTAQSTFVKQANSPSHLQWLSQVSRYSALTGNYYSFDDLIYNDPDFTIGPPPIIYVVDTGFQNDHPDFADRVIDKLAVDDQGENLVPQTAAESNHGTCMVSLAAGSYSGMGKSARIVTAQLTVSPRGITHQVRVSRAFFLLMKIYNHVEQHNAQGNAVVSMSFGVLKASLRWEPTNVNSRTVFDTMFYWYWAIGVSTVASAGNDEASAHSNDYKDLSSSLPRGAGGADTNLIVVGNSQWDTSRHPTSNYRDTGGRGILSLYNLGTNIECGVLGGGWAVDPEGTSQATAITAGMVAYYLNQPELYADWTIGGADKVPWKAKQHLINTARQYKGANFDGDTTPRAALGETVPCAGGNPGRPAEQVARAAGGSHGLSTTQVTDGSEVVIDPLPACWDLN